MYGFENFDNEYAFGTGMSSKEKEKEKEARHRGTGDMVWDQNSGSSIRKEPGSVAVANSRIK